MRNEFENTINQNITIVLTTIASIILFEIIIKTKLMMSVAYTLNPYTGFSQILALMVAFAIFGLPFKRVRKLIWNIIGSVIQKIDLNIFRKNKSSDNAEVSNTIQVNESSETYNTSITGSKNHYKIKIK